MKNELLIRWTCFICGKSKKSKNSRKLFEYVKKHRRKCFTLDGGN